MHCLLEICLWKLYRIPNTVEVNTILFVVFKELKNYTPQHSNTSYQKQFPRYSWQSTDFRDFFTCRQWKMLAARSLDCPKYSEAPLFLESQTPVLCAPKNKIHSPPLHRGDGGYLVSGGTWNWVTYSPGFLLDPLWLLWYLICRSLWTKASAK